MRKVLFIGFLFAYFCGTGLAEYRKKGTIELGGGLSVGMYETITPLGTVSVERDVITPELGYFLADGFKLGGLLVFESAHGGGLSSENGSIYLTGSYIFNASTCYPFLQTMIGMANIGDSFETMDVGIEGGLKLRMGESSLLNIGLRFLSGSAESFDKMDTVLIAGFTIFR